MTTREKFVSEAPRIPVTIAGQKFDLEARDFKTGSVGWGLNAKVSLPGPDGKSVWCQVNTNITVVGSKEW